jgi:hypothetical protein
MQCLHESIARVIPDGAHVDAGTQQVRIILWVMLVRHGESNGHFHKYRGKHCKKLEVRRL